MHSVIFALENERLVGVGRKLRRREGNYVDEK